MIPARKHPWVDLWFTAYVDRYLRHSFHRILSRGPIPDLPDGPVVICTNHSSWWDTLVDYWLSRRVLAIDAYGPMDQRQLRRYPVLSRIGVFGVDRESLQGGREFLAYATELLRGRRSALVLTVQGAMVSPDQRPIRAYGGAARVVREVGKCSLVTLAIDYGFWDDRHPEIFLEWGEVRSFVPESAPSPRELTREIEAELTTLLDRQAEFKRSRDSSGATVLLQARSGVSPVYDLIRRLRGETGAALDHGSVRTPPQWGPGRDRVSNLHPDHRVGAGAAGAVESSGVPPVRP